MRIWQSALVLTPWLAIAAPAAAGLATPDEMAQARRWSAARFDDLLAPRPPGPALVVTANHGPVQKNARAGKPLRLADKEHKRGLYCHAPSHILVRLPGPANRFSARVGVDSNDQTSGGRGSVVFSVHAQGRERFRSGLLREGSPECLVEVDLEGATELLLQVDATPDGIACDQADWAEARVVLRDGDALWLADLPLDDNRSGLAAPSGQPFSFIYDGKPSADLLKGWKRQDSRRTVGRSVPLSAGQTPALATPPPARAALSTQDRTEHTLIWTDPGTGMQVRCVAIEYREFPTVEWTVYFKNTGGGDSAVLSDIQALDIQYPGPAEGGYVLHHHTGDNCTPDSYAPHQLPLGPASKHRFGAVGGRPTTGGFPFFNLEGAGEGMMVVVGWPGQWEAHFSRDGAQPPRIRAGQEGARFRLQPGEEARTPLIVLQFWKDDRVRAHNVWRRWMLAHNLPRTGDGQLPSPILSSCSGGFFPGLRCNEADELRFIDAFVQAGVKLDYWWMDAGWYPCGEGWPMVGTWSPDPQRFPRGLKAVSEHAHRHGLGLIVWFEPERVSPGTWLYQHHPEWLLGREGETKLLNLGHAAARAWLTDHVDRMLTEQGIDFYRQDFNLDPLPYWRAHDLPDRQGLTEMRHVEGYLAFWDELRRRHPGLRIDSCASGGRRNDLETLRRAVPLLRSDYQSFSGDPAYAPGNQAHTYGLSWWIPYYGQGVYYSSRQADYCAHSHFSPAFGFCVDVRRPGVDWDQFRGLTEQWRRAAPCLLGDFHPLTPYRLDDDVWMAWQFDAHETGQGIVQAFRRSQSIYETARLALKGLEAKGRYRLSRLDNSTTFESLGQELLEPGLRVVLTNQPAAALFLYQRLDR
jgi:alpha-galactosidase